MRQRLPGLDLMRALAILLVLLSHGSFFFITDPRHLPPTLPAGQMGVDLFFGLSGWLIGGILLDLGGNVREPRVFAGFWLNRALRTLPTYYLFFLINLVIYRLQGSPGQVAVWRHLYFGQNLFHAGPSLFFEEAWTLSVEEWFYVLFPIAVFLGLRGGVAFGRIYAAAAIGLIVWPLVMRALLPPNAPWEEVNRVVTMKLDAIGWGTGAVLLARRFPEATRRWAPLAAIFGFLLVVECYVYAVRRTVVGENLMGATAFGRIVVPTLVPLGWTLLLPWAAGLLWAGRGLVGTAIGATARWSYLLYLLNGLVMSFIFREKIPLWVGGSYKGAWFGVGVYLTISFSLAAMLHRGSERPVLRWRRQLPWCRAAQAAAGSLPP